MSAALPFTVGVALPDSWKECIAGVAEQSRENARLRAATQLAVCVWRAKVNDLSPTEKHALEVAEAALRSTK
jgi:hypothetical protein